MTNIALPSGTRLRVVCSGAFAPAWRVLASMFEQESGASIDSQAGASVGDAPTAVPQRLARGEDLDVVIMSGPALSDMSAAGFVTERVDLARSLIGAAVRQGAPVPDIATPDALRATLLACGGIALSRSVSGVYVHTTMLAALGIADAVAGRIRFASGEPAGALVARGEAEIAFQQVSELLPVPGLTLLGPLPADLQLVSMFSAGLVATSTRVAAARALMAFLVSAQAGPVVMESGMEPVGLGG
jgi:molybdate transport system substrate-binding protein